MRRIRTSPTAHSATGRPQGAAQPRPRRAPRSAPRSRPDRRPARDRPVRAVVDSWGLALGPERRARDVEAARAAVITTIRERQLTPAQLRARVAARPALPGRAGLLRLITMVEEGSHSELEIWGVEHVLTGPGMPRFVRQFPVALPHGSVRLDAAVPELRMAIELDGAAFHGDQAARERDIQRDVALAALGWLVLRFSYRRLTREPEACRREILAVLAARRLLVTAR